MTAKALISSMLSQGEYFNRLVISLLSNVDPLYLVPGALICAGALGLVAWFIVYAIN